jgi:phosphohistidine swiveling domain-containing protein
VSKGYHIRMSISRASGDPPTEVTRRYGQSGAGAEDRGVAADPLVTISESGRYWTRSNVGEAVPGVMTPLNWSIWATIGQRTMLGGGVALGALSRRELRTAIDTGDGILGVFYGRMAVRADYMGMLGDRLPGMSGQAMVTGLFGRVPEGMAFHPTRRRYPMVAWCLTRTFVNFPRDVRALERTFGDWWQNATENQQGLDRAAAIALFHEAMKKFEAALQLQTDGLMVVIQPVFEALTKIATKAGVDNVATLSGSGHAEIAVISDIWQASRNTISVQDVLRRHGFHGPQEGEIAGNVWRENDAPLRALIEQYAARPDSDDPIAADERRGVERQQITRRVLVAYPWHQRILVRFVPRLGRTRIPMRGVVKRKFLEALDVARFAARRIGEHLVADGVLDDAGDVFYLSRDELTGALPTNIREVVTARRGYWHNHHNVVVPSEWQGMPAVSPVDDHPTTVSVLSGIGVSAGVVEGLARVVTDPSFADVEPDEILIAPYTDPSWSSIMFISGGLVVDIGGTLSHAAVVARELGIPCVVNTGSATTSIATGDRVRVNGTDGTVTIVTARNPIAGRSYIYGKEGPSTPVTSP